MTGEPLNEWVQMYSGRLAFVADSVCKHLGVDGSRARLRTRVTERPQFNARCEMDGDGQLLIEVNLGVAFICEDIFSRLLSRRGIWPEIGDHSLERDEILIHDFYTRADDLFWHGAPTDDYSRPRPRCSTRGVYLGWLNSLAWDFIALHELGHALHGHLKLNEMESGGLEEQSTTAGAIKDPLTRHAVESDADTFAIKMLLRRQDAPHGQLQRADDGELRRQAVAFDVLRAVYTCFHLSCAGMKDVEFHQLDRTHPPPRVRQMLIVSTLLNFVDKGQASTGSGARFAAEVQAMEEHYVLLTGRTIYREGITERLRDSHALAVIDRWREIQPVIARHSLVPISRPSRE